MRFELRADLISGRDLVRLRPSSLPSWAQTFQPALSMATESRPAPQPRSMARGGLFGSMSPKRASALRRVSLAGLPSMRSK